MVREDFTVEMLHLNKNWKEMSESGGTQKKCSRQKGSKCKVPGLGPRLACARKSREAHMPASEQASKREAQRMK